MDSNYLPKYQTAQSADVLYIIHGDYEPRTLGRVSDTNWTVSTIQLNDGPYLPENVETTTLTLSGTTGSVTVTASAVTGINDGQGFLSTDVGRLIRWKDPANNWTWLEITAVGSTTSATATIKGENASAGTATTAWRFGLFSDTTGWPLSITFFQDRLFLGGCNSYPDRWALSRTGGYSDTEILFAPTDRDGTVTDDAAIYGTLQSGQVNSIQWANQDERGLVIGTYGAEWIVRPDTTNGVLTPSNSKSDKISSVGSAYIKPVSIESGTVFTQRARRKVLDIVYNFDRDQLKPRDVSVACEHITATGVAEMAYQQEPDSIIWMRRTDGLLIGLTYYPDEAVFSAYRAPISGESAAVRSCSVIPASDGSRDELAMIVEREVDGSTVKYIEYMTSYCTTCTEKEDVFYVDAGITYEGAATSTVTGLDHLEGETVKLMVNGLSHPDLVVSGGSVTLQGDITGTKIHVGLGYKWAIKTQRAEAGAQDGVAQGKQKKVQGLVVRVFKTLGLRFGPDADNLDEYTFEQGKEYDEDLPLFTGDTPYLKGPFAYDTDGFIYLEHDGVFPACILALMPQIMTQDRG